jgi:glycosyltransferase involved in cell wall biosynthesis
MNIAIVAPSSVPLVMGGAENLWLGLQRYINEETNHHCELFKIPTREGNLLELISSYRTFSKLDLSSYDRVITGKYPAWMVQHPSHVIYMLHTLRGLYDTYHFCNEPVGFEYTGQALLKLRKMMDQILSGHATENSALEPFFDKLEDALVTGQIDAHTARFPGPFARDVVHFLDRFALQPGRVAHYAAISRTVRDRVEYFPPGVAVDVLYPPPRLDTFYCRGDDYLFTMSRLDGPKRVGLLIDAMRHVKSDVKLLIGGKGPDEQRLRQLAGDDKRIVFEGYLSDTEMLEHYANSIAVPFIPYDEDYGLITIEAMRSEKPVITVTDAGGVTEFVVNGETGLVVAPDPIELAKAIDFLCSNRAKAKEMGRNAKRKVADIKWRKVVAGLLGEANLAKVQHAEAKHSTITTRKKMVVATTFPIYPPRGGGQSRAYNLYREWARHFDVKIVSLTGANETQFTGEIAPGLVEVRIPKSAEHQRIEEEYSRTVDWVPVTDIVAARAIHATPEYMDQLRQACAKVDVVVACHPFLANALRECAPGVPMWFEAQDVEYNLKKKILPSSDSAIALLEMVKTEEAMAWHEAEIVFSCLENDLEELAVLYGKTNARTFVVPNGFSTDAACFTPPALRESLKQELALQGQHTVIFMGSWHGPNLEAALRVLEYAVALPSITFLILGSAGLKFASDVMPPNVKILGVVDDEEKKILLSAADLAINPVTSGTGSNLKMFDYFAAGVPVMSTSFGARGMDAHPGIHYLVSEPEEFVFNLTKFFVQFDASAIEEMCMLAAEMVNAKYSWQTIAEEAYEHIMSISELRNDSKTQGQIRETV